jgi:hypothetical protein
VTQQPNPIPARVRGWILVAAIITGGVTTSTIVTMQGLGAPDWAVAAVSGLLTAVPVVAAALSRANLTLDPADRESGR